jgi:hypothetical protein
VCSVVPCLINLRVLPLDDWLSVIVLKVPAYLVIGHTYEPVSHHPPIVRLLTWGEGSILVLLCRWCSWLQVERDKIGVGSVGLIKVGGRVL